MFDQPVREIIKTINEVYSQYDEEDAFIFIHGFNVSFGAAARLTAETIERADFPAVPFLLSWPSRANPLQYTPDMGAVSSSCQPLQPVLQAVGDEFSGPRLTVMAHSMGGKLAMTMIGGCPAAGIFHWQSADEIGAVVYAATDVSKTDFKQTFPTQSAAVSSLTLYASAEDLALKASSSWGVNDAERAGQGGDGVRLLIEGLHTIDATGLRASGGDVVQHGYIFTIPEVVEDLRMVLNGKFDVDDRTCLEPRIGLPENLPYSVIVRGCNAAAQR